MLLTKTRASPRDPNKFPTVQLFLLALVRLAEPIALTSILPYAWKLVLHFHVGHKRDASFYAGLLIAAFAFAEALTGMFWGGLSDRIGRKPVLIMGCFGTLVSLLIVGFSANLGMALLGRFLGGALNGNIGVIQTMVGELVQNPKHEPKAYAVMPFVWSVGTILGPSIGGYFADPAVNFPDFFSPHGIFGKLPYLLPNLVCAGLMVVSIIAAWVCLEETHPDMQPWSTVRDLEETQAETPSLATQASTTSPAANLAQDSYGTFNNVSEEAMVECWNVQPDGSSRRPSDGSINPQKAFTPQVIMLTVAMGIFTYHSMTYDHLLPIFFQDDRVPGGSEVLNALSYVSANNSGSLAGGLGLSVKAVGIIMSFNGLIALVIQAIVFPVMASWLGVWKVFLLVIVLHPLAYFIVPWLALLPPNWLYPGIYTCLAIRNFLSILAYPVLLILLKEAAPKHCYLGKINGLAASTGAACRTIAAPVAGYLYGLGIMVDFTALAWWASALVAAAGAIQAFFIHREPNPSSRHQVRAAAPCRLIPGEQPAMAQVVRIKVYEPDSAYASDEESTPLVPSPSLH